MSIEVSIVPESDSANSESPPKIDVWETGAALVLQMEYPKRTISITKFDLQRLVAIFCQPNK